MKVSASLEACGLTKSEATVYLTLLQQGSSSALSISRTTNLKRPTVYLILEELIQKGLVALVPGEKKKLFLAMPPERLEEEAERRRRMIRKAMPELSALYREQTGRPSIQLFESREGILSVYRDIALEAHTTEILSFVSLDVIAKEFKEAYDLFIRMYEQGIRGREIISTTISNHFYLQKLKNLPNYGFRIAEPRYRFFTDNIIYGNKMAMFSFKKRFAFVTESEDVVNSWRSLFELAWQSARET